MHVYALFNVRSGNTRGKWVIERLPMDRRPWHDITGEIDCEIRWCPPTECVTNKTGMTSSEYGISPAKDEGVSLWHNVLLGIPLNS